MAPPPLFSQLPSVVLKKYHSEKRVKFTEVDSDSQNNEDEDVRQVTSSWPAKELEPVYSPKLSNIKPSIEPPVQASASKKIDNQIAISEHHSEHPAINGDDSLKNKVEVLDAIVQTNPKAPTKDISTQTYDTYPPMLENYNLFKSQLEANALSKFNPMYSFPQCEGKLKPPLKIGLTLPRGKKRKVFYPDEQEEELEVAPGS